jgi:hypothetical protein
MADLSAAEIIQRCKPNKPIDDSMDLVSWYGRWLAMWLVRAVPDSSVRTQVLTKAEEIQHRL